MAKISRSPLPRSDAGAKEACALGGIGGGVGGGGAVVVADQRATEPHGGRRKRPGITVKRAEEALRASGGVKLHAAELLGVHRSCMTRLCKKHPRLEAVIMEVTDMVIDLAETRLIENIRAGDLASIRYFLDNRGGARGYGRKVQLDGNATIVKIAGPDADL